MDWAWWGVTLTVLVAVAGAIFGRGFFRGHPTLMTLVGIGAMGLITIVNLVNGQVWRAMIFLALAVALLASWRVRQPAK